MPYKIRINYFSLLRNRIQLSELEDLFFFIQQFMNQAASNLASRKALQGTVQNGRKGVKLGSKNQKNSFRQGHLPLREGWGVGGRVSCRLPH